MGGSSKIHRVSSRIHRYYPYLTFDVLNQARTELCFGKTTTCRYSRLFSPIFKKLVEISNSGRGPLSLSKLFYKLAMSGLPEMRSRIYGSVTGSVRIPDFTIVKEHRPRHQNRHLRAARCGVSAITADVFPTSAVSGLTSLHGIKIGPSRLESLEHHHQLSTLPRHSETTGPGPGIL